MYQYILFDLDGTLLDTSAGILKSIDYTIKECGFADLDDDIKHSFIGPPIISSLKNTYNLSDEEAVFATEVFRNAYKDFYLFEASVYNGIFELLQDLNRNGFKTAVATYKRDDYAKQLLEHFDIAKHCDYMMGSDVENKLTKGDIIKICLRELSCSELNRAVLVGDTEYDLRGAKECGIDFIGVTYGFGFRMSEEALKGGAIVAFETVTALRDFLLG